MRLVQRETVILAENYDALVDWYVQVLGFRETKRFENGYRYCNLESEGGVHIGIAPAKEMGVVPGDGADADRSRGCPRFVYDAARTGRGCHLRASAG